MLRLFIALKKWCVLTALLVMILSGVLMGVAVGSGVVVPAPSASAQSVTQGYGSDDILQRGIIVNLKKDDPTKVEPTTTPNMDHVLGVVVNSNDSPITLSNNTEKVFVATVGRYEVLVSDQNGAVNVGDYVSVSALNGIGMRASMAEPSIIGRATTKFDGKSDLTSTSTLTDSQGGSQKVNIGRVQVDIAISKNPEAKSDSVTPQILSKIGQAIAGRSVSASKIYISVAVFFVGAFIAGAILYAGVRSSIVAIGRNPLSKKSILRGLISVVFTSLIIFIISLGAVYLLLKL